MRCPGCGRCSECGQPWFSPTTAPIYPPPLQPVLPPYPAQVWKITC